MRDVLTVRVFDSYGVAVDGGTDFLKMNETTRRFLLGHC